MAKFNTAVRTTTYEGGTGYARDVKTELFLLAVSNMVGENTFYESAESRDTRFAELVRKLALDDAEWTARFLGWLRGDANMRTASLVGAAEFAKARVDAGVAGMSRQVIDSVLKRADEPGEMLAYWTRSYGRNLPKPVKRGIADAVSRLYDERSLLKWDSNARSFKFADVLSLVHPKPRNHGQALLFEDIVDRRFNPDRPVPAELGTLAARTALTGWDVERRRDLFEKKGRAQPVIEEAGMTWEALGGWLQGPLTRRVWESVIPSMGYMALLRNLRNFDQAGVSDKVAKIVAQRIADPEQVARSRQLPMRFLSAYRAAPSERWASALEKAIACSLGNVPELPGRTLVLIDTSYSMHSPFSKDGSLMRWDAAAVFGLALAARCAAAKVVSFSSEQRVFKPRKRESLLRMVERWKDGGYFLGGGTDTTDAVRGHFAGHDRVVIITDEQAAYGDVSTSLPGSVPIYTWNLAGYRYGHTPVGTARRYTFGGLTDQAFRMIPLIEAGETTGWPF